MESQVKSLIQTDSPEKTTILPSSIFNKLLNYFSFQLFLTCKEILLFNTRFLKKAFSKHFLIEMGTLNWNSSNFDGISPCLQRTRLDFLVGLSSSATTKTTFIYLTKVLLQTVAGIVGCTMINCRMPNSMQFSFKVVQRHLRVRFS